MEIQRNDRKEFARQIINIAERDPSPETLSSLNKVTSLLVSWAGKENSVAVNLSEFVGELERKIRGDDTGWSDEFKKILTDDLSRE